MIDDYSDTWIVSHYTHNAQHFSTDLLLEFLHGMIKRRKEATTWELNLKYMREIEGVKEILKMKADIEKAKPT